jgi:hypothetical protein
MGERETSDSILRLTTNWYSYNASIVPLVYEKRATGILVLATNGLARRNLSRRDKTLVAGSILICSACPVGTTPLCIYYFEFEFKSPLCRTYGTWNTDYNHVLPMYGPYGTGIAGNAVCSSV